MSTTVAFVEVESSPSTPFSKDAIPLKQPARVVSREYGGGSSSHRGHSIELGTFPTASYTAPGITTSLSRDPDLERSRPASPVPSDGVVEVTPSWKEPFMNRFRLLAVCIANLVSGLNDSAAGALIPYLEVDYSIGYAVVSLIFVGQAVGFIVAAFVLDTLRVRLGRAKLLGLGQALMALGYIPLVVAAPYPVVVVSFFFVGFGIATSVAMGNIFCGSLRNSTFILGLLHGSYGLGGTTGPLIATALVTVANSTWNRYYILPLSLVGMIAFLSVWSFWNYEKEQTPTMREREAPSGESPLMGMLRTLKLRVVQLGALFIFAYQGAEVSISGWVISFLINVRDGDPSSVGYVTAGFWAGITIGRFVLSGPAQRIGEKVMVYWLTLGALAFQILVWFVPDVVTNAVAVSIVGLMLGPIYPCSAAVFMRNLSGREALSGMGTISACGALGGAVAPFLTGLLAQAVGTFVLHPVAIFLFVVMLGTWYAVPAGDKKSD